MNISTSSTASNASLPVNDASTTETPVAPSPAPSKPANAKVAVNFINRSNDRDLLTTASRILVAMTGNVHYPVPVPSLAAVTTARDALLAVVNNGDDSSLTLATRRQLRPPLNALLRQLAQYVQIASKGDPVVLMGSGFPLQRARQPVGVLAAPGDLRLSRGKLSGQLRARCKAVPKAASYQWRIGPSASPGVWLPADPTTAAATTLSGLTPGTLYVVQVRAIGSKGPGDWSEVATQIAM